MRRSNHYAYRSVTTKNWQLYSTFEVAIGTRCYGNRTGRRLYRILDKSPQSRDATTTSCCSDGTDSPLRRRAPIIQWNSSGVCRCAPIRLMVHWAHPITHTASRSLQPFCRVHGRSQQTDRQSGETDHATPSLAICCILAKAAMWPKMRVCEL